MKLCRECRADGTCPNMERIFMTLLEHGCIRLPVSAMPAEVTPEQQPFIDQVPKVTAHVRGDHRTVSDPECDICKELNREEIKTP